MEYGGGAIEKQNERNGDTAWLQYCDISFNSASICLAQILD